MQKATDRTSPAQGAEQARRTGRREVLKAGALALAAGVAAPSIVLGAEAAGDRRFAMVIDLRKCIGCHACAVACKSEFGVPLGAWRSAVKEAESGKFPATKRSFLPWLCNHCANPPCVKACPTDPKATIAREDGAVIVKDELCIGCEKCVEACPYGARYMHPKTEIVEKCTFCVHRVDQGVVPSCVNTCQGEARIFGDLNDPDSAVAKLLDEEDVDALLPELRTGPQVYYIGASAGMLADTTRGNA